MRSPRGAEWRGRVAAGADLGEGLAVVALADVGQIGRGSVDVGGEVPAKNLLEVVVEHGGAGCHAGRVAEGEVVG